VKVFDRYAECYDALYEDKDYRGETNFIIKLLTKHGVREGAVLELGCGTGAYTSLLAEHYHPIVGIDFSFGMLAQAKMKLGRLPEKWVKKIHFQRGDIRTIRLRQKFNTVLAMFHVMSYQESNRDLVCAFKTAARHLTSDGLFVCDFWYGPGVLTELPVHRIKKVENAEHSIVRRATPELYPNRNAVLVHYDISFLSKHEGITHQIKEEHLMRYLFKPEIDELCQRTGFQLMEFGEWLTGKEPTLKTWNAYIVGRRLDKN
jgi:SAM-dependent methyltransferase